MKGLFSETTSSSIILMSFRQGVIPPPPPPSPQSKPLKSPPRLGLKCKFLRLLSARVTICQIHYVNFETTSQFLFKFCVTVHYHDTKLLCKF